MKWIGLALLIVGAMLAADHGSWIAPSALGGFALGSVLIGYWYWVERELDEVPPDESDFLPEDQQATKLEESSTSFDLPDLAPFLQRLSSQITGGYTPKVIAHIADLAARMRAEEGRDLEYEVIFQGRRMPLKVGLFKEGGEEIGVYFHTTPPLVEVIDREMDAFFTERGM